MIKKMTIKEAIKKKVDLIKFIREFLKEKRQKRVVNLPNYDE
jgi:hypothetical protein